MTWALALAVGLGAGIGSALRFGVELAHAAARRRHGLSAASFPWATLVVNAIGSGALGLLTGSLAVGLLDEASFAVLGAGVCGGLTTFSTLALDLVLLVRERRFARASGYLAAQVLAGLALFALGLAAGRTLG